MLSNPELPADILVYILFPFVTSFHDKNTVRNCSHVNWSWRRSMSRHLNNSPWLILSCNLYCIEDPIYPIYSVFSFRNTIWNIENAYRTHLELRLSEITKYYYLVNEIKLDTDYYLAPTEDTTEILYIHLTFNLYGLPDYDKDITYNGRIGSCSIQIIYRPADNGLINLEYTPEPSITFINNYFDTCCAKIARDIRGPVEETIKLYSRRTTFNWDILCI